MTYRTMKLMTAALLSLLPFAASAADHQSGALVLANCSFRMGPYYPGQLIERGVQGRVLLKVERRKSGSLRVLSVEASSPRNAFDKTSTKIIGSYKCPKLEEALVGLVSITFSLYGGEPIPPLEGVQDQVFIRGCKMPKCDAR